VLEKVQKVYPGGSLCALGCSLSDIQNLSKLSRIGGQIWNQGILSSQHFDEQQCHVVHWCILKLLCLQNEYLEK
jgi:hypothetical protein